MKQVWLTLTISAFSVSCARYDRADYLNEEKNAIQDLILEMTDYEALSPTIYINYELGNNLKISDSQYEEISQIQKVSLEPLAKSTMAKRVLPKNIFSSTDTAIAILITENEYQNLQLEKTQELHKYLDISRVLFTPDFEAGYITYATKCNKMCGSNSILLIKKVDGHWTIDEFWEWPTVRTLSD